MSDVHLIVGLGNPGRDYEQTRHNLGFVVVQQLAGRFNAKFKHCSFSKSLMAKAQIEDKLVCLFMPETYMNNSGIAISQILENTKSDIKHLLVVSDDCHLPFGQLRLRTGGSDGGHNGLKSIGYHLGTTDFARLRLGIGRPRQSSDVVRFVLENFGQSERRLLDKFVQQAAECCIVWIKDGIIKAMEQFNRRKEHGEKGNNK